MVDIRTGKKVSGEGFGCERTKRKDTGNSEKSLRKYRRQKVSKGCRSIRESRYEFQPGTVIQIGNKRRIVSGCHNKDALIQIQTKGFEPKDAPLKKCKILIHSNGWDQKARTAPQAAGSDKAGKPDKLSF